MNLLNTPMGGAIHQIPIRKERNSNLELYRVIVMLLIVAHHYVVLSGLIDADAPLKIAPFASNSLYLYLFGMWGKTGINCFILITGYFMCSSNISLRKFIKLYMWILTYRVLLKVIFVLAGVDAISVKSLLIFLPFTNIHSHDFVSAFMAWWLFIPFLNVLLQNVTHKQHLLLMVLMVFLFSIVPFVPKYLKIESNPICWFSTLYVIAAYIRKYQVYIYKSASASFWRLSSVVLILIAMFSVVAILWLDVKFNKDVTQYYMVSDSDKPLALLIAISTFMWFKNLKIGYSKIINILGGASFGVLLIHSGSRAMMNWLWKDTIDCVGRYSLPLWQLMIYSIGCVFAIYAVCTAIDYTRLKFLEEPFFKWYDTKFANNNDKIVQ